MSDCTSQVMLLWEKNARRTVGAAEHSKENHTQRVQVPHISGLWSQKPLRVWLLESESFNIGYLDPLGQ